ncbi:MAG: radical SAM protein [Candidatus Brockarchaeota archaeon]|nr:radical SAM protein [Candidatus Brockarchaeota archaeon]
MASNGKEDLISKIKEIWSRTYNIEGFLSNMVYNGYIKYLRYPYSLTIYLTFECPNNCIYCYLDKTLRRRHFDELTTDEWQEVFRKCEGKVPRLILSGGEPTIRSDFMKIFKSSLELGGFKEVVILTNGIGINEPRSIREIIKLINNNKHTHVQFQVTLDGGNATIHELSRPGIGFKSIVAFVKQLRQNNIDLKVVTILSKLNYIDIPNICKLINKLNVKRIHFSSPIYIGEAKKNIEKIGLGPNDYLKIYNILQEARTLYKDMIISSDIESIMSAHSGHYYEHSFCSIARMRMAITPNGYAIPCELAIKDLDGCFENIRLYNYDVKIVWQNSEEFNRWRDFRFNDIPCIKCEYMICKILCPVILRSYGCDLTHEGFIKFISLNPYHFCPVFNNSWSKIFKYTEC